MPDVPAHILARLLFPRLQSHLQRRMLRHLCAAIIVGLIIAGAVGVLIYLQGTKPAGLALR